MDHDRHPAAPSNPAGGVAGALDRMAAVARQLAESAMARGDCNGAADYEELAIVAEHKAALIRG